MTLYMPDTNVWVCVGKEADLTAKCEKALANGDVFLIAPPALIEVVRGMVRCGKDKFSDDRKTFSWMQKAKCKILELPKPFMAKRLKTRLDSPSGVTPEHYSQLIEMILGSPSFDEFVEKSNADNSAWKNIEDLDQIHEREIEKELRALETLAARKKPLEIHKRMSNWFGAPGCRPNPLVVKHYFSAAIEYLETSVRKVANGAKPRKNDRGLYVDFQLLAYLADSKINFLTNENFSGEISKSPQRTRIVKKDVLPAVT
jgi:hypothetical protein